MVTKDSTPDEVAHQRHYTARDPEPIEVIQLWDLDYLEGNVLKYLARWRFKNGVEDLRKMVVYATWLKEREENKEAKEAEERQRWAERHEELSELLPPDGYVKEGGE